MIRERAPAKVNLVLHVGSRRADGLHELCSLFASVGLADELEIHVAGGDRDRIRSPGVEGPNLCEAALQAFRRTHAGASLPPLEVAIDKRIPVAAGLGGGSADAAAVLRAADALVESPLGTDALREVAAQVGADVPSQVEPGHAFVGGAGEIVEFVRLPQLALVLIPDEHGLSTADVYREADRIGATRASLDPAAVRALADGPIEALAAAIGNDLQAAALSLRPDLADRLEALERCGALAAQLTGSGPTAFGLFRDAAAAAAAAERLPGALTTGAEPARPGPS
jgi:4-diphosphocytidyl-2-C-methyl-D-erythritol kinase